MPLLFCHAHFIRDFKMSAAQTTSLFNIMFNLFNYQITRIKMFWNKIEKNVGENLPKCVKKILESCGYSTIISLKNISSNSIIQIENHINTFGDEVIQQLDCCNHEFYRNQHRTQQVFKLLPGHRECILSLPNLFSQTSRTDITTDDSLLREIRRRAGISKLLFELVKTAIQNEKYAKNSAQYSDIVRYFASFIYIMCGRSCYDVLYQNLPRPSISTICK